RAVVGQQQQAFAVVVEPTGRIDVRDADEFGERAARRLAAIGELAEHPVRLVEQDQHGDRGRTNPFTSNGRRETGDGKRLTWELRRARRMTAKIFLRALRVLRGSVFRFRPFARWSRAKRTRLRYCLSLSLSAAGALSLPCEKIASPCGLTNF